MPAFCVVPALCHGRLSSGRARRRDAAAHIQRFGAREVRHVDGSTRQEPTEHTDDPVPASPSSLGPGERVNRAERCVVSTLRVPGDRPSPVLTGLSTAAQGGALWLVMAAVLALRPGRSRRAAIRGASAVALASAGAHLASRVIGRRRPRAGTLPAFQALPRKPTSPSFPSSHAATATAFVVAVAHQHRPVGWVLMPIAATVAYSRIRTFAHWPSDVVSGMLWGAIAAAWTNKRVDRLCTRYDSDRAACD